MILKKTEISVLHVSASHIHLDETSNNII